MCVISRHLMLGARPINISENGVWTSEMHQLVAEQAQQQCRNWIGVIHKLFMYIEVC